MKLKKHKRQVGGRVKAYYRLIKILRLRLIKYFVYWGFRCWLRNIYNYRYLPKNGPAIIVSNHLSYFDWGVLSAIYGKQHLVFIANRDILRRPIVGWLMWINIPIFIDPHNPQGSSYIKEALNCLKAKKILVIYPEGTRSKSGKMMEPKTGFVKIALKSKAKIIPVGMKGSYETLPPHKKIPRFKRFDICVGKPIDLNETNVQFSDLISNSGGKPSITDEGERKIAFRIMEKIRRMTKQQWDPMVGKIDV